MLCLLFTAFVEPQRSRAQTIDPATARPAEGIRESSASLYALQNARVVVSPGEVLPQATVIIERDSIRVVGANVAIPAGAELISLEGKTIYAGLIDAAGEAEPVASTPANSHWNRLVTPDNRPSVPSGAFAGSSDDDSSTFPHSASLREQGITTQLIAPAGGIFSGESHVALTGGPAWMSPVVKESVAQHLQLTIPRRGGGGGFPASPMGAMALVRQMLIDADWYRQAILASRSDNKISAPVYDPTLQKIADAIESQFFMVDCPNERFIGRADAIAREFSIPVVLKGSGREYQLLDTVAAAQRTLLLPVAFPKAPNVSTAQSADEVTLTELMHWYLAPENPSRLAAAGVRFALTTADLEKTSDVLPAVRSAVKRGLSKEQSLAALTTIPADLMGLDERMGTVAPGKLANLIVVDGDLFDDDAKVIETWVAGRRYRHVTEMTPSDRLESLGGKWVVKLSPAKGGLSKFDLDVNYKAGEKGEVAQVEASFSIEAPPKSSGKEPTEDKPRLASFSAISIVSRYRSATQRKLKLVIYGGYDAALCSDLLKREKVAVILPGTYRLPLRRDDAYDAPYTWPARLHREGVTFCIAAEQTGHPGGASNARNLPYHAGNAIAYGLDPEVALRSVTLAAAEILGVDDRVGSLTVGKEATLMWVQGDPLLVESQVTYAMIQGRPVDLGNKHLSLFRKYEEKYRRLENP